MALVAYTRFRFKLGPLDIEADSDAPTYDASNTEDDLAPTSTGRRAILRWTRTGQGEDVVQTHFDFVNVTAGQLDDTWTTGDFTTCEGAIDTWWAAILGNISNAVTLSEIRWYRIGPGAVPPEPAVRTVTRSSPGTVSGGMLPPQIAATVTFKTGVRKRWGRIYVPMPGASTVSGTTGQFTSSFATGLANATHALVGTCAAADFYLSVWSKAAQNFYTVEQLQVDDIPDVQRRRRERKNIVRITKP